MRTGARPFQYTGLGEEAPDPDVFPGRGLAGLGDDFELEGSVRSILQRRQGHIENLRQGRGGRMREHIHRIERADFDNGMLRRRVALWTRRLRLALRVFGRRYLRYSRPSSDAHVAFCN